MSPTEAYLALNLLPKIGPIRVRRLLETFQSPERVLAASPRELQSVDGIGAEMAGLIANWEDHIDLAEEKRRIRDHGIDLVTLDSDTYPKALREIHDPPFLLYVKGTLSERDKDSLAIVGSRRATHYGIQTARKLSFQLAHAGLTIVSGLARGIDTAAHEGALAAKGRTLAVLGSGIGKLYPPENQALADKIVEDGCGAVISEFPVLSVPDKQSFPLRNRIVSGLSFGILVVEAPGRSESLITANQALEQGRNVYAIPGQIDRPSSEGANRLIQQGAKLVLDGQDILDDIDTLFPSIGMEREETRPRAQLGPDEEAVYAAIDNAETQIDTIIAHSGLPAAIVSATLLRLEMKRLVKPLPGGYFVKLL